jgi:ubiquinone/menaquinone biosynthesis C-methylase UbiE
MSKLVKNYCNFPSSVRRPMWRIWHNLLIRFDDETSANFMNYGYESLNGDPRLKLKDEDEPNRYGIQLYNYVVKEADIQNKDVLEVGSGRGGGASFITSYYKPKKYVAVDISSKIIEFCNKYYNDEGLEFVKGRAENLPLEDNSFDVVVNVESARCYSDLMVFFKEVKRVLRPGGQFMFADMIENHEVEDMKKQLTEAGFKIEKEKDITDNVVKALDKDSSRREELINKKVPGFLKSSFLQFAGAQGTERYNAFKTKKFHYYTFVLSH